MSIHYKFRSSLDYDTLKIDGQNISLADLRDAIMSHKKISRTSGYTLEITNAQTKEVYSDDRTLIPKNSSVIVKRVPATTSGSIASYAPLSDKESAEEASKRLALAKLSKTADLANADASEEDKIKAMMSQVAEEWDVTRYGRKGTQSGSYTCYKCGQAGHFIRNCPSLNTVDTRFGLKPVRRNYAGIPKEHLIQMMKDEEKKRTAILEQAGQRIGTYRPVVGSDIIDHEQVPLELQCPLCKKLFSDAVLIPCCGTSYCDECVRDYLIDNEFTCPNCQTQTSPDKLVANKYLRTAVEKYRNQQEGMNKGVIPAVGTEEQKTGTLETKVDLVSSDSSKTKTPLDVASPETADGQEDKPSEVSTVSEQVTSETKSETDAQATKSAQLDDKPPVSVESRSTAASTTSSVTDLKDTSAMADRIPAPTLLTGTHVPSSLASFPHLPQNFPFSATPLAPSVVTSTSLYNTFLNNPSLRLTRGPIGLPALNQSVAPLPAPSRVSSFSALNVPHPAYTHITSGPGLGRGQILPHSASAPRLGPIPPIVDPVLGLDDQRPLSEEEFYRAQRKLKYGTRHKHDEAYQKSRYHKDRDRRRYYDSKRNTERAHLHKDKIRESPPRRRRGALERPPLHKRSRSPDSRRKQERSRKLTPKSRSISRSRSPSASRSFSSRSPSGSRSRSASRSPEGSRSPGRISRSRSGSGSFTQRQSRSATPKSRCSHSARSGSNHSFSRFSNHSNSTKSRHSSTPRKWSTSPEGSWNYSPSPDDAISLSPASKRSNFSYSESDYEYSIHRNRGDSEVGETRAAEESDRSGDMGSMDGVRGKTRSGKRKDQSSNKLRTESSEVATAAKKRRGEEHDSKVRTDRTKGGENVTKSSNSREPKKNVKVDSGHVRGDRRKIAVEKRTVDSREPKKSEKVPVKKSEKVEGESEKGKDVKGNGMKRDEKGKSNANRDEKGKPKESKVIRKSDVDVKGTTVAKEVAIPSTNDQEKRKKEKRPEDTSKRRGPASSDLVKKVIRDHLSSNVRSGSGLPSRNSKIAKKDDSEKGRSVVVRREGGRSPSELVKKAKTSVKEPSKEKGQKSKEEKVIVVQARERDISVGLKISKDKDGTVREVLTSRGRKRAIDDDIEGSDNKVWKEKNESRSAREVKKRVVRVVSEEDEKKVGEVDQRRVVLGAESGDDQEEVASETKSHRSGKKKSKNKKHKKQKHKKTKHRKHKHKKSKNQSDSDSDDSVGAKKVRRDADEGTDNYDESEEDHDQDADGANSERNRDSDGRDSE